MILHDYQMTSDDIAEICDQMKEVVEAEKYDNDSNHIQCANYLLTSTMETYRDGNKRSIGDWIAQAAGRENTQGSEAPEFAHKALATIGLKVEELDLGSGVKYKCLCIATKHQGLAKVFDKTPWQGGVWTQAFRRFPQAQPFSTRRFGGVTLGDLTALWKAGELPEGAYYCNTGNQIEILYTWGKKYNQLTNNKDAVFIPEMDDCIIVGSVPSYEQNIKLQKHSNTLKQALAALDEEQVRSDKLENALTLCRNWLADMVGVMNNESAEHNKKLPVGNFERAMKEDP